MLKCRPIRLIWNRCPTFSYMTLEYHHWWASSRPPTNYNPRLTSEIVFHLKTCLQWPDYYTILGFYQHHAMRNFVSQMPKEIRWLFGISGFRDVFVDERLSESLNFSTRRLSRHFTWWPPPSSKPVCHLLRVAENLGVNLLASDRVSFLNVYYSIGRSIVIAIYEASMMHLRRINTRGIL